MPTCRFADAYSCMAFHVADTVTARTSSPTRPTRLHPCDDPRGVGVGVVEFQLIGRFDNNPLDVSPTKLPERFELRTYSIPTITRLST